MRRQSRGASISSALGAVLLLIGCSPAIDDPSGGGGSQGGDPSSSGGRSSGGGGVSSSSSGGTTNPPPATTWTSAKFGGGYVTGLIFHPTSANVLYARTDVGGAYRWNRATTSSVPITDGFSAADGFHHGVDLGRRVRGDDGLAAATPELLLNVKLPLDACG